jgi:hypothetical protein|tara:strand:- start:24 stop:305 length:282 start_codon:yes stop_codon:yes gene_type:complete
MNAKQSIISYCKFKNIQNRGFLKYGYYKRIIGYILDYYNDYFIRKTFLALVNEGYFIKKKNIKKSYIYQFNPEPKILNLKKEIDPTIFVVSWD